MKETDSAGGIVINTLGKVLLATKDGETWMLPKGHVDPGEQLLEAAKREIWEETGLPQEEMSVVGIEPLGMYQRYKIRPDSSPDPSEFKSIYIYHITTHYSGALEPIDTKHKTANWFEKSEVAELLRHPEDKEFFTSIIDKI